MIELRNLSKRYGGTLAVDDLSFSIRPGVVTGFLGPNGAGKSTTMRMILGLDRPTGGTVEIDGREYGDLRAPMTEIGALLEAKAVHGGRRAGLHLRWLAQSNGLPTSRVAEVLELVGLTGVARRRLEGFSLGMSQRLGIAAALLGNPKIVMFDEPVNGLDPDGIHWIRTLMKRLAGEGRTVFVSSHLMSEMALTADHLVVIGRGRLLADLPTRELVERSSGSSVRVRTPQRAELTRVVLDAGGRVNPQQGGDDEAMQVTGLSLAHVGDLAYDARIRLHELTPHLASLEEAFFEMTRDSVDYRAARPEGDR